MEGVWGRGRWSLGLPPRISLTPEHATHPGPAPPGVHGNTPWDTDVSSECAQLCGGGEGEHWGGPPGAEPQGPGWAEWGRARPEHRAGQRPSTRENPTG